MRNVKRTSSDQFKEAANGGKLKPRPVKHVIGPTPVLYESVGLQKEIFYCKDGNDLTGLG